MLIDYVFVEAVQAIPSFVAEDLRSYGPYPAGFKATIPLKAAWLLARGGYCKPSDKNGTFMFRKEVIP